MSDHVLTLIAGPQDYVLDEKTVVSVRERLHALGADVERADWLAPGRACDIGFAHLHTDQADAVARVALDGAPVDVIAQGQSGRRKKLLLADMESTLIHNEMLDELAEFVGLRAGNEWRA